MSFHLTPPDSRPKHNAPIYLYATDADGGGRFVAWADTQGVLVPYCRNDGGQNLDCLSPELRATCEGIIALQADNKRLLAILSQAETLGREAWQAGLDAEYSGDIAHCDALAILSGIQEDAEVVEAAKDGAE